MIQSILSHVTAIFTDPVLLNVTPLEFAIFQSPDGVLFDKSILQRYLLKSEVARTVDFSG